MDPVRGHEVKTMIGVTTACVLAAGIALASPARSEVQGGGFTELILSCTGESNTVLRVNRDRVVMLRSAPECDRLTPVVFKAHKDRKWFSVFAYRDGMPVEHRIKIKVTT